MDEKEFRRGFKVHNGERELLIVKASELLLRYVILEDERAKEELLALDSKLAGRASLTVIGEGSSKPGNG